MRFSLCLMLVGVGFLVLFPDPLPRPRRTRSMPTVLPSAAFFFALWITTAFFLFLPRFFRVWSGGAIGVEKQTIPLVCAREELTSRIIYIFSPLFSPPTEFPAQLATPGFRLWFASTPRRRTPPGCAKLPPQIGTAPLLEELLFCQVNVQHGVVIREWFSVRGRSVVPDNLSEKCFLDPGDFPSGSPHYEWPLPPLPLGRSAHRQMTTPTLSPVEKWPLFLTDARRTMPLNSWHGRHSYVVLLSRFPF